MMTTASGGVASFEVTARPVVGPTVRFDVDGVTFRVGRAKAVMTPWAEIRDLIVLSADRGKPQVLLVNTAGIGLPLVFSAEAEDIVARASKLRPHGAGARTAPTPKSSTAPVDLQPTDWRTVPVLASLGVWSTTLISLVVYGAVASQCALVMLATLALPVGFSVWRGPDRIMADVEALTIKVGRKVTGVSMRDVDRFVLLLPPSASNQGGSLVVQTPEGARSLGMPHGLSRDRMHALHRRLESLRVSAAPRPSSEAPEPANVDGRLRAPWHPTGPLRWIAPSCLAGVALLMFGGVVIGSAIGGREADTVRARSIPTTGSLIAVNTWASRKDPEGIVSYKVGEDRRIEVVMPLLKEDESGVPIGLAYDPLDPARVWRTPNASPPRSNPSWLSPLIFTMCAPLCLAYLLWRRWYPPHLPTISGTHPKR